MMAQRVMERVALYLEHKPALVEVELMLRLRPPSGGGG